MDAEHTVRPHGAAMRWVLLGQFCDIGVLYSIEKKINTSSQQNYYYGIPVESAANE